ncbi:MAG: response regulator [Betaproteobacteria bacterium]|nr:response regulator [Betaproteobacteria bacterium]
MKTILIVEDDFIMRELLRLHLSSAGYAVRVAADGIEAGRAVLSITPDLIITDVNMPHMDGFELVAALKADPSLADIPVIFLTIEGDAFERGRELGALEYLAKPIRLEALLQKVAKHLPTDAA